MNNICGRTYTEPEHVIDEYATIKGAVMFDVYDKCLSFFKKPLILTNVLVKNRSSNLKIDYQHWQIGSTWVHMLVEIRLSQVREDIIIELDMWATDERARACHHDFLIVAERLWRRLRIERMRNF